MKTPSPALPLTHALGWIIGSLFATLLLWQILYHQYIKFRFSSPKNPEYTITHIIQTGPQKEALKTEYLAELIGLSYNYPQSSRHFNLKKAEERLLQSPLIQEAKVKVLSPHTLYIDYAVRQPVAWFYDYHNVAFDKLGFPIPFTPFFAPKNLIEIYLGCGKDKLQWNHPVEGKEVTLAFEILNLLQDPKIRDLLPVKRIDVSHAFSRSLASREVILVVEDEIVQKKGLQEVHFILPRLLRLSPKKYTQELGNYLKLREKLLANEVQKLGLPQENLTQPVTIIREKPQVIDFRLENLAFIGAS